MIRTTALLAALLAKAALGAADVIPDHSLLELAEPVRATILREAAGRDVVLLELGSEDGRPVYYVRIRQQGLDKRLTIGRDGTILAQRDFKEINDALAATRDGSEKAWEKTKEGAKTAWDATKETVGKAVKAFGSDDLTLNQVPARPRAALERAAAGNRLGDIHYKTVDGKPCYEATIKPSDGKSTVVRVDEDGVLMPAP
jgi:uncharacterized membrane protein YkoI